MFERSHVAPVVTRSALVGAVGLLTLVLLMFLFSGGAQAAGTATIHPLSTYTIDDDGDGMNEYLVVREGVQVDREAEFHASVEVFSAGASIATASLDVWLSPYYNTFEVRVPGNALMGIDSANELTVTVTLMDEAFQPLADETHALPGYDGSEFEAPAYISRPPSETAKDDNGDGDFECIAVDLMISSNCNQTYWVRGTLKDASGVSITSTTFYQYATSGGELPFTLRFVGPNITALANDGPYAIDLELCDQDGNVIESASLSTSPYARAQFQGSAELGDDRSVLALDTNGDGSFDEIKARTDLHVLVAGKYTLDVFLLDGTGGQVDRIQVNKHLQAGTSSVEVDFPGTNIANHAEDGVFTVEFALKDAYGDLLDSGEASSASYMADDFESLLYLMSASAFSGSDGDGDGAYETVSVDVAFHSTGDEYCDLSAVLTDASGAWAGYSSFFGNCDIGDHTITMTFSGADLVKGGTGPYTMTLTLRQDLISDEGTWVLEGLDPSMIEPEMVPVDVTDAAVDLDGNGLYDQLQVTYTVDVNRPGDHYFSISMMDLRGAALFFTSGSYWLETGRQTITLSFQSGQIADLGVDGPYEIQAYPRYLGPMHRTAAYASGSFQQNGWFEAPISDQGIDTDGNGLYDKLQVDLTVNVLYAGDYYISGYLTTGTSVNVHLEPGPNLVQLGINCINWGEDGSRPLTLELSDSSYERIDTFTYVTNPYMADQFDSSVITSFSDFAVDENGNGMPDLLRIELGVEVTRGGYYLFDLDLRSPTFEWVASTYIYATLAPGYNLVTLDVRGQDIYDSGIDGPYEASIRFYEMNLWYPIRTSFLTDGYLASGFEHSNINSLVVEAVDDDGDDLTEFLMVSFDVYLTTYGSYAVEVKVYAANGTLLGQFYPYSSLNVGSNLVQINVSSLYMIYFQAEGPYLVEASLYQEEQWYPYERKLLDTDSLTVHLALSDMEKPGTISAIADQGEDSDGNGFLEGIKVTATCEALHAGNYQIAATLRDASGNHLTSTGIILTCEAAGYYPISLLLWGDAIYQSGLDGPYNITLTLFDLDRYMVCDFVEAQTQGYSRDDFEHAFLESECAFRGEDSDGNGLYDRIVVDLTVNSTKAMWCGLYAALYGPDMNQLGQVNLDGALVPGLNGMTVSFDALFIGSSDLPGPYTVQVTIYTDIGYDESSYVIDGLDPAQYDHVRFTGAFTEELQDADGDGLSEALVVQAEVESSIVGEFVLVYMITDSDDNWLTYSSVALSASVGRQWVSLSISGAALAMSNGGPFKVTMVIARDYSALSRAEHVTDPYPSSDFEAPAIFVEPCTDSIESGDLMVEATVEVSAEGRYWLSGSVAVYYDWMNYWQEVESTGVELYLFQGTQTVSLRFSGLILYNNGIDGPYRVTLTLADGSSSSIVEHMTAAYDYNAFNSLPIQFTGYCFDYGNDIDGNGLFEQLLVEVGVDVLQPFTYQLTGYLYDANGNWIGSAQTATAFDMTGQFYMTIGFSGRQIMEAGLEGPYRVELTLWDDWWNYLTSTEHWTGFYAVSWFEWPALLHTPVYGHGLDTDSDGLFDFLAVDVEFEVQKPGKYLLVAELYDYQYGWIDIVYYWDYFDAGMHSTTVLLPGNTYLEYYLEGYPQVMISLEYQMPDGHPLVLQSEWAWFDGNFSWSMFEIVTQMQPPHSDHLTDRDLDDLWDWLAVEVTINVVDEGKYTLVGELYANMFTDLITEDRVVRDLKPGLQTITLYFSAVEIWAKGLEGPFQVELRLFDRWGNQIEEGDHYVVSAFSLSDCERITFKVGNRKGVLDLRSEHVEVIIFGSKMANAHRILPRSVRLGDGEEWARPCKWEYKDVNHDGRDDLVLTFKSKDLKEILRPGEDVVVLRFDYRGSTVQLEKLVEVKFGRCDR